MVMPFFAPHKPLLLFYAFIFQVRTPYHCILLNLAIIELLLAVINIPIDIYSVVLGHYPFSQLVCTVTGFIATTNGKTFIDFHICMHAYLQT